jgi:hypothetical protein
VAQLARKPEIDLRLPHSSIAVIETASFSCLFLRLAMGIAIPTGGTWEETCKECSHFTSATTVPWPYLHFRLISLTVKGIEDVSISQGEYCWNGGRHSSDLVANQWSCTTFTRHRMERRSAAAYHNRSCQGVSPAR